MKPGSPRFSRAIIGTLLLGVVLIAVFALAVETTKEEGSKEEAKSLSLDQLPAAVRAVAEKHLGTQGPFEAKMEKEGQISVYDISVEKDGKEHSVEATEKGDVLSLEKEISASQLPDAAAAAVKSKYPNATIKAVSEVQDTSYDVEILVNGEAKELNVKATGKIESEEEAGEAAESHETANRKESVKWIDSFPEDKADLVSTGKNPYFILEPGYTLSLEDKDKNKLTITVLNETKNVDGVETRIVEERETEDGKVVEISRNFFAISKRTNNVYYFGEDSREFKNDQLVSQGGSWEAGVNGARFGLMMPGAVVVGSGYYQEVAPKVAMDRAQYVSTSETVVVPAGTFQNCLKTEETSPLEPRSKEYKYYAPGVGLLKDGDFRLVRYGSSNAAPKP